MFCFADMALSLDGEWCVGLVRGLALGLELTWSRWVVIIVALWRCAKLMTCDREMRHFERIVRRSG